MDYKRIYKEYMKAFRLTSPIDRLKNRNEDDFRLSDNYLYTEVHHITPRSLGGTNEDYNLVELLPEEHLFAHKLRYKAFNKRQDMLALRFIINGVVGNNSFRSLNVLKINRQIKNAYIFIKQNSAKFRKDHGWQTIEGVSKISEYRKNKIPLKNKITKEIKEFNMLSEDFKENFNKDWEHPTKGFLTVICKETNNRIRVSCEEYSSHKEKYKYINDWGKEKNGRWTGISDNDIIEKWIEVSKDEGRIIPYRILRKKYNKFPTTLSSKNRGDGTGLKYYLKKVENTLGIKYNPYFRTDDHRKKLREANLGKKSIDKTKKKIK